MTVGRLFKYHSLDRESANIGELGHTISQEDPFSTGRTLHPTTAKDILFKHSKNTHQDRPQPKQTFTDYKELQSVFSEQNVTRLERIIERYQARLQAHGN